MEGYLSVNNLKILGKGLLCLSKLGLDVTIDQTDHGLIFRTLNNTQSSYAQLILKKSYFINYNTLNYNNLIRCKLNIKNILFAFKSLNIIERACFKLLPDKNYAILEFECISKVIRKFVFHFEESSNILQASFSRSSCPNYFISDPSIFENCLNNFHSSMTDISLFPSQSHLIIKNYSDDKKKLSTEYYIDKREFTHYELNNEVVEITFCIDELKAIRSFCSACRYQLHLFFDFGGSPILMSNSIDEDSLLILEIIVSTMQLDPEVARTLSQSVVKNMKSSLIAPAVNNNSNVAGVQSDEKMEAENIAPVRQVIRSEVEPMNENNEDENENDNTFNRGSLSPEY